MIGAMFMLAMFSCKPQVPSSYIQPDEMEDILYDYYIADGMANNEDADAGEQAYNNGLYKLAVLKKHGVSQADFDSSLVYYARHADRLHRIYENIEKRLASTAVGMGASAGDYLLGTTENADTADIWNEERSCALSPSMPSNVLSYNVKADTAFHKGDRIVLSFDTRFIYQDGTKDGVAMLALRLDNDSVVSRCIHMSSASHYTLNVSDDKKVGIKEVYGFIFLAKGQDTSSSIMKLMFVDNIRLVKMHSKLSAVKEPDVPANDTVGNPVLHNQGRPVPEGMTSVRVQDMKLRRVMSR